MYLRLKDPHVCTLPYGRPGDVWLCEGCQAVWVCRVGSLPGRESWWKTTVLTAWWWRRKLRV